MALDEDSLLRALAPDQSCISVPNAAVDLFPRTVGPRILHLPDQNQIIKAGPSVKMSEAEAMRFVALHTSIPVPEVQEAYNKNGCGYIVMSKADGEPLADIWQDLGSDQRASVVSQLRNYAEQLRSLTGQFYGALWGQACEDIFFNHLPFHHERVRYGPYYTRQQFNDGLIAALENSRPNRSLAYSEKALASRIRAVTDETKTFSHGDFHPLNILANRMGDVTAIVDWESAGFSICGREYYEARKRSRNDEWDAALDEIFPEEARAHFDLLKELDQTLIQYTVRTHLPPTARATAAAVCPTNISIHADVPEGTTFSASNVMIALNTQSWHLSTPSLGADSSRMIFTACSANRRCWC
ncbi:hypothetical protein AC578_4183 [Pseudocercospora eumusae]|uniref:Aminoglycoside phosphotransferase domain-containing protein n=1 Tax=Pseudocercospora eumusae TaxID=321146 RepID=A0A139HJF5_9PEZI|nr:hypothetical protein AC578_4183 [Pseudocercospora eumusae]